MKEIILALALIFMSSCTALAQTTIDRRVYETQFSEPRLSADELCIAYAIYHEARGEPRAGKQAVAHVILNRAQERNLSPCDVVWQRKQFSWTLKDPLPFVEDRRQWDLAKGLAVRVHSGALADITLGANHYHRHDISPKWSAAGVGKRRIGAHVFMKIDF